MKEIVMIPIGELHHHPENPRKDLGDLTELAESIRKNGVMQNLTVIEGRYRTKEEFLDGIIRLKKDEIIPFLEEEIATRFWFQEAGVKVRLRYDKQLMTALEKAVNIN